MVLKNNWSDNCNKFFHNNMRKILVVDDDPLILLLLERTIKRNSLEVTTVQSGGEALSEVNSSFYNVCFLDVHLPDINGIEVMRKIKTVSPKTRVIIMTCDDLGDADKKEIEHNAYEFIPKPFDLLQIRTLVKHAAEETPHEYHDDHANALHYSTFVEKRSIERKPLTMPVEYVFDLVLGESKTLSLRATIVDTSKTGLGIQTEYPLHYGQIITFKLGSKHKTGLVKWSSAKSNTTVNKYRAGVKLL